ncbi:NUDIX hydrolase [Nonomuraea sp. NPDC049028]|uniref:NUDIX hydrolase n=1 Tax=Nonomuraea sp. NPDC049028 TaxID=3364348 RepID=UPI00371C4568
MVTNVSGDVLLISRPDNGSWALPGRAIDLGESIPASAIRETLEETGVSCEITGFVGTYSDPKHVILYTRDGKVRQEFSIVLTARAINGEPTPSQESREVRWVPRGEAARYRMDRSMRLRIEPLPQRGRTVHRLKYKATTPTPSANVKQASSDTESGLHRHKRPGQRLSRSNG